MLETDYNLLVWWIKESSVNEHTSSNKNEPAGCLRATS